eukprot:3311741-Rhodomonas_salina.7
MHRRIATPRVSSLRDSYRNLGGQYRTWHSDTRDDKVVGWNPVRVWVHKRGVRELMQEESASGPDNAWQLHEDATSKESAPPYALARLLRSHFGTLGGPFAT